MQMNEQKYHRLILLLLLAAFSMPVFTAVTEDPASDATQAEAPSEEQAQSSGGTDDMTADDQQDKERQVKEQQQVEEQTPAGSASPSKPITPFNPTDKIQADSAVSFPIDI